MRENKKDKKLHKLSLCILQIICGLTMLSCTNKNGTSNEGEDWDFTKGYDSLKIELFLLGVNYDLELSSIVLTLSKEHLNCEYSYKGNRRSLIIDDSITRPLQELADSLFIKESVPIYEYREESDEISFHEGDIMDIVIYKGEDDFTNTICLEDVYYTDKRNTEDGYDIVYSKQFRLFVQYLHYLEAVAVEKEGGKTMDSFIKELQYLEKEPNYEILFPKL